MSDLEAIRARNEEERASIRHRHEDGDTFYCCPMCHDYLGHEDRDYCNCPHDERKQRVADIDALLAEVERMTAKTNGFSKRPACCWFCHRPLDDEPHPFCNEFLAHRRCKHERILTPTNVATGQTERICARCGASDL